MDDKKRENINSKVQRMGLRESAAENAKKWGDEYAFDLAIKKQMMQGKQERIK
jgi:hypothetical protein